ncbi:hypothetical protein CF70_032550 [Cupriavidus sp. SK-3]|nr:hypothetical protein CF70_032550 [Cupriavidus sp. SK-3]
MIERFAADPTASVPVLGAETVGAYRFCGNDSSDWRDIMGLHWQQTQQRMRAHPVALCLQGTTELDVIGQGAIGLGH